MDPRDQQDQLLVERLNRYCKFERYAGSVRRQFGCPCLNPAIVLIGMFFIKRPVEESAFDTKMRQLRNEVRAEIKHLRKCGKYPPKHVVVKNFRFGTVRWKDIMRIGRKPPVLEVSSGRSD